MQNLVGSARTLNQRAVAAGLAGAFNQANLGTVTAPNGVAGAYVAALNNVAPGAIPGILDSLSGEGITATQNLAHRSAELFTSTIFDQTTFYGLGATANSITLTAPQPGGFQALASGSGTVAPRDTLSAQALGLPVRELADLPSTRAAPVPAAFAPIRT